MAAPTLEARVAALEGKYTAHDALLRTISDELERQGRELRDDGPRRLAQSHHDIQIGTEMQVAQLRLEMRQQAAQGAWLAKENRALAFGLAVLLVMCWLVSRVNVDATGIVALVAGILAALGGFWAALNRGAERARKDSIAPGPPDGM